MPQSDPLAPSTGEASGGRPSRRGVAWRGSVVAAVLGFGALTAAAASAAGGGGYTSAQATSGSAVYANNCSSCHAANLKGGSGPPLVGPTIAGGYKTAAQLHDFIKTQMPANAPNSLSAKQYLDVTAYVLSKNGVPAGGTALSASNLGSVQLAAGAAGGGRSPGAKGAAAGHGMNQDTAAGTKKGARSGVNAPGNNHLSAEIVRAAPPTTKVFAKLPAGANVAISDDMMRGAAGDGKNWLVDGRTYDNQRYSPLTQIDSKNVTSLVPVALVQTGITASFETTPIVVNGVMYLTTPVVENKMKISRSTPPAARACGRPPTTWARSKSAAGRSTAARRWPTAGSTW